MIDDQSPVAGFAVELVGDVGSIDPADDNADVYVELADGSRYIATFFTVQNLRTLLARWQSTGENACGLYVWSTDMIVVERLTRDVVTATVADLLASGDFKVAFSAVQPPS